VLGQGVGRDEDVAQRRGRFRDIKYKSGDQLGSALDWNRFRRPFSLRIESAAI
jgi:hypothetical protein